MSKKEEKKCVCDTQKKHGRNLCFKTNAFRFNILNSIYERFYCFNGDQDNRVIPEKKIKGKNDEFEQIN